MDQKNAASLSQTDFGREWKDTPTNVQPTIRSSASTSFAIPRRPALTPEHPYHHLTHMKSAPYSSLEILENRIAPAGVVTADVKAGVLTITGDDLANEVLLIGVAPGLFELR